MTNKPVKTPSEDGEFATTVEEVMAMPNVKAYVKGLEEKGIPYEVVPLQRKPLAVIKKSKP